MTSPIPRRARIIAAVVLFLVAVAGGLTAIVFDRFVLRPPHGPPFHGFGRGLGGGPERERAARERFAKELGLTPAQRVRIDSLMDRQLKEIRAVREQVQPRLDSIVGETRREIDAILTPEQRKKAQEMAQRRFGDRGEWRRGPDLGPPDGPMGPPPSRGDEPGPPPGPRP